MKFLGPQAQPRARGWARAPRHVCATGGEWLQLWRWPADTNRPGGFSGIAPNYRVVRTDLATLAACRSSYLWENNGLANPSEGDPEGERADWRFRDPEPFSPLHDDDEDLDPLHWVRGGEAHARRSPPVSASPPGLLPALSEAEDALSRLDACTLAAPEPVRDGLAARVAFREASGWLAHAQAWVHPTDLCLRDLGLTGSFLAAAAGGRLRGEMPETNRAVAGNSLETADTLPDDMTVGTALTLARTLRRLATHVSWRPLASAGAVQAAMAGVGGAPELPEFEGWKTAWRRGIDDRGALLASIEAAAQWPVVEEARGASDWLPERHLRQILVGALAVRACGRLQAVPLPFWSSVTLGRPTAVVSAHSSGTVLVATLRQVAEGARAGLREVQRLLDAHDRGATLASGRDRRSRLPAAVEAALRTPAITPGALARQIGVAPQTANDLLRQLVGARVVREVTGRMAFRAYSA
jgi:hypothetical protein